LKGRVGNKKDGRGVKDKGKRDEGKSGKQEGW